MLLFLLQDQVPPFPSETALSIVQEELGAPLENIFDSFDHEPIAAASLGISLNYPKCSYESPELSLLRFTSCPTDTLVK